MTEELVKYNHSKALMERELEENAIWFNGDPTTIEYFFKVTYPKYIKDIKSSVKAYDRVPNFWNSVSGDIPRIHSGIAALISRTWVRLIKTRTMKVEVEDKSENDLLQEILKENNFISWLNKAIVTKSWAGYTYFKFSYDEDISKYPIIEMVDPRYVEIEVVRKRIKKFTFKIFKIVDGEEIIIYETYEMQNKVAQISYRAVKVVNGKEEETPLPQGYERTTISIDFIPAFLMNNTTYNSRFTDSILGESDYKNVQSLFHMLDSILSNTELDVDNAKAVKFVSEDIIKKDDTGEGKYDKNEVVVELSSAMMQDPSFDIRKLISLLQPLVRVEQFNATAKEVTGRILANIGLSPVSVGLPGFDSIDAAADSQRARKETSIVSRDEKVELITEFLVPFFDKLLKYHHAIHGETFKDNKITVEFDKYGSPQFEDLVDTIVKARQGGVMTVKQAVEKLYPELTPDEIEQAVVDIKGESMTPFLESDIE